MSLLGVISLASGIALAPCNAMSLPAAPRRLRRQYTSPRAIHIRSSALLFQFPHFLLLALPSPVALSSIRCFSSDHTGVLISP